MYFTCSLLPRAVCYTMGYVSGKGFLIVYTSSKHIEKLEISNRRMYAYLDWPMKSTVSTDPLLSYYLFRIVCHFLVSHALHNNYL